MKNKCCWFVAVVVVFFVNYSLAIAADKVVVISLGGAVGDATVADVVKGKTFSSKMGKGLTGTMEQHPMAQSYTNSIGMTFNLIPSGIFTMGSSVDELGRSSWEIQHQVTLSKPFYMQITEVTNKQWNTLIIDNTALGTVNPSLGNKGDDYPVNNVNWFEAAYFANILSVWESRSQCYTLETCSGIPGAGRTCFGVSINPGCTGYRLPTEAEWEYTARATTTTAYANPYSFDTSPSGTTITNEFNSNLHAMGWYEFNNELMDGSAQNYGAVYPGGTKPVAQKQSNRWGLYDMHGNVYEWCQDWFDASYYSSDPVTDPQGAVTGLFGDHRVIRGGAFSYVANSERSAARYNWAQDEGTNRIGFRLILPQSP
jgi:formylglycine-generating enzyme required for sulfatase activity